MIWDRIKYPLIAGLLLCWFSAVAIAVVATHKPVSPATSAPKATR
jgi:hypothetical protein